MFQRTRDYAKDYERIGSTVRYIGKYYRLTLEQPAQNRRKAAYVFSMIAAFALFVAVGFSGSPALGAGGGATPLKPGSYTLGASFGAVGSWAASVGVGWCPVGVDLVVVVVAGADRRL